MPVGPVACSFTPRFQASASLDLTLGFHLYDQRPARHYPRFRIRRPSSGRLRDLNPPDLCAAQRTIWAPPTPQPGLSSHFAGPPLIGSLTPGVTRRPGGVSPVPKLALLTFRSLYTGGFFSAVSQALHAFLGLRPNGPGSAPSFLDHDAAGFTLCCGLPGRGVIASTVGLLLAPDGHYRASWPLP